ncbi:MAG: hypothetical protein M3540_05405, partial [Actinomycetota bacterium]|nr:hypothetical protein [Actinomycetota bacterium]
MGLRLLAGPANAGKVELLLDRYLDALDRSPVLIVPNRADVNRIELELVRRRPALLAGEIGTFDDLFRRLVRSSPDARPVASETQRLFVVRRAIAAASLNGLSRSARFGGFADALLAAVSELESGLLEPAELEGDLGGLYGGYRAELDRLGLWDADLLRRHAAERLASDLDAWHGQPVFAYGFEDLTGAEWALIEALSARAEVTVSLPYEPGRPAFASLARTAEDLARLAGGAVEELPPKWSDYAHPAIAHVERHLFSDATPAEAPPIEGAIRFFEGAGARGALELVTEEVATLLRAGTDPEQIGIVCPSLDRLRAPLETALGTLAIPYAFEGYGRLAQTPFGRALLALLRFAWLGGDRTDLFSFLRTPYSGIPRAGVDFVEGRLRGRAVHTPERIVEEFAHLRGAPIPYLDGLRDLADPVEALREVVPAMLRAAYGLE